MVLQQFGGINAVCFYASSIFEVAGFSPSVGTILYAILQVVVVFLSTTIIDKVGRKPLLLVSASGLVISCLITGFSFYLKVHELALKSVPMLAVTGILKVPYIHSHVKSDNHSSSLAIYRNIFGRIGSNSLGYNVRDIPFKYQRSCWKRSNTGELVLCMGSFLHLQPPFLLELLCDHRVRGVAGARNKGKNP
ncbi:hypothetical protein OIU84_016537 [Salix udensis]|uniref:Major facilitator superfamily (MFS) profile domain-containing protein n=1 Tax=Salix udensis TaxID=889485 RepID=A0AAD6JA90_9ROSI|nr:hypothetical protein OIU84_016537 [Salix udensis]